MTRTLFTLCSAVSLLLCAAVCVLWARSYRLDQYARVDTTNYRCAVYFEPGAVVCNVLTDIKVGYLRDPGSWDSGSSPRTTSALAAVAVAGPRPRFGYRRYEVVLGASATVHELVTPAWALAALAAVPPLLPIGCRAYRRR